MAVGREIRVKFTNFKNMQKVTRAMEMVAASKMRRAQERMDRARPYAQKMRNVIGHVAHAHSESRHPYLLQREVRRAGLIIVSTDRGLCGGLNANMLRLAIATMKEWREAGVETDLCTIGTKAAAFFRRHGGGILAQADHLGDAPRVSDIVGVVKVMLDAYTAGEIDRLSLIYNVFVNTMTQRPQVVQLLPLPRDDDERLRHHWDYIYEPETKDVMDVLMVRYIESLVFQGVTENIACEQAARMVAMKSASDNAGGLIDELQLAYNKARQAAITTELADIIGGAAAVAS